MISYKVYQGDTSAPAQLSRLVEISAYSVALLQPNLKHMPASDSGRSKRRRLVQPLMTADSGRPSTRCAFEGGHPPITKYGCLEGATVCSNSVVCVEGEH
jgi:hypothetical protein